MVVTAGAHPGGQMDLPNNGAGGLGQSAAGYENGRAGGRVGVADWESVSVHSDIGGALGQDASQMHGLNSKCVMRRSTLPSSSTPTPCASWPGLHAQPPAPVWQAFALHQVHLGSGDEQQGARRRAELPQRRVSLPPCCWVLSTLVPPPPPPCRSCMSKSWRCATRSSSCAMSSSLVRPRSATIV